MNPALAAVQASQHGLFTVAQAVAAGFTRAEIANEIRVGRWKRVRRGVLGAATAPANATEVDPTVGTHLRAAAADLLSLDAGRPIAMSHETAAVLHGIHLLTPIANSRSSITMPPGSPSATVSSHVHRAALMSADIEVRDGLPCTTAARTVVDLARSRPFADAVVAADSALHQRLTSAADLMAALDTCGRWPGRGRARRVLDFADLRAESPYESLARVRCAEQGLPKPTPQLDVLGANGRHYRSDLGWDDEWTVLEVDGVIKYVSRPGNDPDRVYYEEKLRADMITEGGYEIVRLPPITIVRDGVDMARRVWAAMERARRRHGRRAS